MKELSIEEKAKCYDEAIEVARRLNNGEDVPAPPNWTAFEVIFPELKESEDERIRKELLEHCRKQADIYNTLHTAKEYCKVQSWVAWLEKQGEQKPTDTCDSSTINGKEFPVSEKRDFGYFSKPVDKIEPKFHEGDWIVHHGTENIYQVVAIIDNQYQLKYGDTYTIQKCTDVDRCARLWDITKDAKDGDVLATEYSIFIFKYIHNEVCTSYCEVIANSKLSFGFEFSINSVHPATKKQSKQLEKAITEAGYEWDAEEKKLEKIKYNKAKWKNHDEEMIRGISNFIGFNQDLVEGGVDEWLTWLKNLEKDLVEQKPAWSEEDEKMCQDTIQFIETGWTDNGKSHLIPWLKSLKDRVGCAIHFTTTKEWSEEDEIRIKSIIALLKEPAVCAMDGNKGIIEASIKYLKSLKERYTWKPSDEQLAALFDCQRYIPETNSLERKLIGELYEDLKKLKG